MPINVKDVKVDHSGEEFWFREIDTILERPWEAEEMVRIWVAPKGSPDWNSVIMYIVDSYRQAGWSCGGIYRLSRHAIIFNRPGTPLSCSHLFDCKEVPNGKTQSSPSGPDTTRS